MSGAIASVFPALLWVVVGVPGTRIKEEDALFQKKQTLALRGLAIFVIVFHHIAQTQDAPSLLWIFRVFGYLGVVLFLFMSGYGLEKSTTKENWWTDFWKNRILKIYVPFLGIQLLYMPFLLARGAGPKNIPDALRNILLGNTDSTSWYILSLTIWYMVFWVGMRFLKKKETKVFFFLVVGSVHFLLFAMSGMPKVWYDISFAFPLGVIFSLKEKEVVSLLKQKTIVQWVICLVGFVISFLLSVGKEAVGYVFLRMLSTIFFIYLCVLFSHRVRFEKNQMLQWIGKYSFMLYLVHNKILMEMNNYFEFGFVYEVVYLAITILLSVLMTHVAEPIRTKKLCKH